MNTVNPKVSVILPSYNHGAYLPKRIGSILRQTFTDFELIILDDCSTDNSREIIESYLEKYPEISLQFNEKNSGSPFIQWNKGVAMAKGQYLWIAESDDYCEPTLLENLVPELDQNPQAGIAYAQSYLVNEQDEIINSYLENLKFIYKGYSWEKDFYAKGSDACRNWLLFHNPIPNASGALIRKEAYLRASGAPENMKLNGDWFLYAKILSQTDLIFKAEPLNYFRVHQATQRERSRLEAKIYDEIKTIIGYIEKHVANSSENAQKAYATVGDWWIGSLPYQARTRVNRNKNRELFHFFKKYKSKLRWRIFLTYLIVYTRSFLISVGLLKPLKNLRSKLFPGKYFEH